MISIRFSNIGSRNIRDSTWVFECIYKIVNKNLIWEKLFGSKRRRESISGLNVLTALHHWYIYICLYWFRCKLHDQLLCSQVHWNMPIISMIISLKQHIWTPGQPVLTTRLPRRIFWTINITYQEIIMSILWTPCFTSLLMKIMK